VRSSRTVTSWAQRPSTPGRRCTTRLGRWESMQLLADAVTQRTKSAAMPSAVSLHRPPRGNGRGRSVATDEPGRTTTLDLKDQAGGVSARHDRRPTSTPTRRPVPGSDDGLGRQKPAARSAPTAKTTPHCSDTAQSALEVIRPDATTVNRPRQLPEPSLPAPDSAQTRQRTRLGRGLLPEQRPMQRHRIDRDHPDGGGHRTRLRLGQGEHMQTRRVRRHLQAGHRTIT